MARAFGIDAAVFETLLADPEAAAVPAPMLPVLKLARAVTLSAGWSEEAMFEAISIIALYNYMNRLVDAAGLEPGPQYLNPSAADLKARRGSTYTKWGEGLMADREE